MIHYKPLKIDCCSIKYPWGWRCQNIIKSIANKPKTKQHIILPHEIDKYSDFYKTHFRLGCIQGYKMIYQSFNLKIDFLKENLTNPSLSIALNSLQRKKSIPHLDLNKIETKIIDSWFEINTINSNDKFLGMYCNNEVINNFVAGTIGPEIKHLWDQIGYKQVIRVVYQLSDRIDVWDWERDIILPDQEWQISNINQII